MNPQNELTTRAGTLPDLATRANSEHAACLAAAVQAVDHARAAGEALAAAKEGVPHGEWRGWLSDNFQASARTAQIYMQMARRWPEIVAKAQHSAHLSVRGAMLLLDERPADEHDEGGDDEITEQDLPELTTDRMWFCRGENGDVAEVRPDAHDPNYHRLCVHCGILNASLDGVCGEVVFDTRGMLYTAHPGLLQHGLTGRGFRPIGPWVSHPWDGTDSLCVIAHQRNPAATTRLYAESDGRATR